MVIDRVLQLRKIAEGALDHLQSAARQALFHLRRESKRHDLLSFIATLHGGSLVS